MYLGFDRVFAPCALFQWRIVVKIREERPMKRDIVLTLAVLLLVLSLITVVLQIPVPRELKESGWVSSDSSDVVGTAKPDGTLVYIKPKGIFP